MTTGGELISTVHDGSISDQVSTKHGPVSIECRGVEVSEIYAFLTVLQLPVTGVLPAGGVLVDPQVLNRQRQRMGNRACCIVIGFMPPA